MCLAASFYSRAYICPVSVLCSFPCSLEHLFSRNLKFVVKNADMTNLETLYFCLTSEYKGLCYYDVQIKDISFPLLFWRQCVNMKQSIPSGWTGGKVFVGGLNPDRVGL